MFRLCTHDPLFRKWEPVTACVHPVQHLPLLWMTEEKLAAGNLPSALPIANMAPRAEFHC